MWGLLVLLATEALVVWGPPGGAPPASRAQALCRRRIPQRLASPSMDEEAATVVYPPHLPDTNDPFELLGLDISAAGDMSAIKGAYKRQAKAYHPDASVTSSTPEEVKLRINSDFSAINSAYEELRENDGMKDLLKDPTSEAPGANGRPTSGPPAQYYGYGQSMGACFSTTFDQRRQRESWGGVGPSGVGVGRSKHPNAGVAPNDIKSQSQSHLYEMGQSVFAKAKANMRDKASAFEKAYVDHADMSGAPPANADRWNNRTFGTSPGFVGFNTGGDDQSLASDGYDLDALDAAWLDALKVGDAEGAADEGKDEVTLLRERCEALERRLRVAEYEAKVNKRERVKLEMRLSDASMDEQTQAHKHEKMLLEGQIHMLEVEMQEMRTTYHMGRAGSSTYMRSIRDY